MALAVMPDDTSGNDSMGAVTTAPAPGGGYQMDESGGFKRRSQNNGIG